MAPEQIFAALQKLDVNNDSHWTQDGMPRLETVRLFAANQALTRDDITKSAPDFTRLVAYNTQQASQAAPATVTAAVPQTQPSAQDTQAVGQSAVDPVPSAAAEFCDMTNVEQLAAVEEELAQLDKYMETAKKHRTKLQLRKDDLVSAIDKETPRHSNQHDIQAYLRSQNKLLEQRAAQIANVKKVEGELGARLSDLVPKRAPIDAAMSRRSGYGRKRPGT